MREEIIKILTSHPLSISQTKRSGTNGLRNADEVADKIMKLSKQHTVEALVTVKNILQGEICTMLLPNEQIRGSSLIKARGVIEAALKTME